MANEEVMELVEETEGVNPNVAYIVNISYLPDSNQTNPKDRKNPDELFDSYILDIPPKIFEIREKNPKLYLDVVETFAYNTISRKTGREVAHCQIYLADIKESA